MEATNACANDIHVPAKVLNVEMSNLLTIMRNIKRILLSHCHLSANDKIPPHLPAAGELTLLNTKTVYRQKDKGRRGCCKFGLEVCVEWMVQGPNLCTQPPPTAPKKS